MSAPVKANRKVEKGQATRQLLVATATRLFATRGYEDTPIEAVLDEAGVSRGALYHHFSGKEALFEAVLEQVEADLADRVMAAVDPAQPLRSGCLVWLKLVQDPQVRRIVLVDAPSVVGWERWREIDECHWFGLLKSALAESLPPGRLDATSVDVLAHMLLAAVTELAFVVSRAEDPATAAVAGEAAVGDLLERLLVD